MKKITTTSSVGMIVQPSSSTVLWFGPRAYTSRPFWRYFHTK